MVSGREWNESWRNEYHQSSEINLPCRALNQQSAILKSLIHATKCDRRGGLAVRASASLAECRFPGSILGSDRPNSTKLEVVVFPQDYGNSTTTVLPVSEEWTG